MKGRLWFATSERIAADYADDVQPCVAEWRTRAGRVSGAARGRVLAFTSGRGGAALQSLEDEDALWGSQGGKAARQAAGAFVVLRGDVVNTGDDVRGPRALRPRESFRNLGDADAGAFVRRGPVRCLRAEVPRSVWGRGAVPARRARAGADGGRVAPWF